MLNSQPGGISFAAQICAATEQVFKQHPKPLILDLDIASIAIRLKTTNPNLLAVFSSAIEHHRAASSHPKALIRLWSAAEAAIERPRMPEAIRQRVIRRRKDLAPGERHLIDFDPGGRMITVIDPDIAQVNVCLSSIDYLPHWERAAPLRSAINWILRQQDIHLLHAAAVSDTRGGALLLGAGGAGKSSASLRCYQAGMTYLGDDLCAIQAGAIPRVFNVYGTAKTVWSDLEKFQDLHTLLISQTNSLKAIYALNQAPASRIGTSSELRVLLLLDRSQPAGTVRRANPAKAVAIAASTTASFLPGSGRPMLSALADIARRLPVLSISLGEESRQAAALVRRAIREPEQLLQDCDDA